MNEWLYFGGIFKNQILTQICQTYSEADKGYHYGNVENEI